MVSSPIKTLFPSFCDRQSWSLPENRGLVHDLQWVFNGSRKNIFVTLTSSSAIEIENNEGTQKGWTTVSCWHPSGRNDRNTDIRGRTSGPTAADSHTTAEVHPPTEKWMRGNSVNLSKCWKAHPTYFNLYKWGERKILQQMFEKSPFSCLPSPPHTLTQ